MLCLHHLRLHLAAAVVVLAGLLLHIGRQLEVNAVKLLMRLHLLVVASADSVSPQ